ncbi:MAG: hypothetical protein ACFB0G_01065 [Leptolyngbyaceae cyanobacterium]
MSKEKKLTPEEARQMVDEIKQHEAMIQQHMQHLRASITNAASAIANAADGRDLDDPGFRAQLATQVAGTTQLAEMAINLLKGRPPSDADLLDYCMSEEFLNHD